MGYYIIKAHNDDNLIMFELTKFSSVLISMLLTFLYVGSLYVWQFLDPEGSQRDRDHPTVIRRRVLSVCIVSYLSPWIIYSCSTTAKSKDEKSIYGYYGHTLATWLGLRTSGFIPALFIPLLLTMLLFLGPIVQLYYQFRTGSIGEYFLQFTDADYWNQTISDMIWIRNVFVAPATEEFVFRSCLMPILVPSFGHVMAVVIDPVFFGAAHYHHVIGKLRQGSEVGETIKKATFQFAYTFLFGIYSAFLFIRTGHFVGPALVHAFCNSMGFPDIAGIREFEGTPTHNRIIFSYIGGFIGWFLLLLPLTDPSLYENVDIDTSK